MEKGGILEVFPWAEVGRCSGAGGLAEDRAPARRHSYGHRDWDKRQGAGYHGPLAEGVQALRGQRQDGAANQLGWLDSECSAAWRGIRQSKTWAECSREEG